ncbi:hypothetical protein HPP92_004319 [Vanilla planifolia]|uniref:RIN4 pathogenic type III effector avirulence factor Avr cleavage site domain-containing protein n=1 Tax=Vanilla planifolia TaxID=51239 RepID=A0A835VJT8_VANPL|nr:hypothetical protein HPP92_004319 [Vanilla planifolia]
MDGRKEGVGRFSVPAFGEWDGKIGVPDYSIDFSRIREHRRQSKSRVSLGNEEELLCSSTGNNHSSESLQNTQQLPQHKGSSTVAVVRLKRISWLGLFLRLEAEAKKGKE